jgi:hypothetical protein
MSYLRGPSASVLHRRVAYGGRKGRSAARRIKRDRIYPAGTNLCCLILTPKVVDLAEWKAAHSPHEVGWATCLACGFRAVCVAPVARDQDKLECDKCGKMEMEFE